MELQFFENAPGFLRWKDLIQSNRLMRRQITQNHSDDYHPGIQIIHQPLHAIREIVHSMLLSDAVRLFGLQRFEDLMQIRHIMALLLVVHSLLLARFSWQLRVSQHSRYTARPSHDR